MAETINLSKYLGRAKVCSRRGAAALIMRGAVKVDGVTVLEGGFQVPEGAMVTVDGKPAQLPHEYRYFMLNKPAGYVCTHRSGFGEKRAIDLMPDAKLGAAGRLDKESEGLLVFSDDGDWLNRISHPSFEVLKCYFVQTREKLMPEDYVRMRAGVEDDGEFLKPRMVVPADCASCYFVLNEGKKREIRRLIRLCCLNQVEVLRRMSVGRLPLGDLAPGKYRELSEAERELAATPNALPGELEKLLDFNH
ncbi:MAG: pseudouridine synthase [Victivallaceae bacterium]|nr:pseudouridine synthase [Victivallaceae bacterium]